MHNLLSIREDYHASHASGYGKGNVGNFRLTGSPPTCRINKALSDYKAGSRVWLRIIDVTRKTKDYFRDLRYR